MTECWKKPYDSWRHARNDARRVMRKIGERHAEPYICRHCGHIHVGTHEARAEASGLRYRPKAKGRSKRVAIDDD